MGMCISVYSANTYMYFLTKSHIDNPPLGVKAFYRYIDDILNIVQPYTHDSTVEFFSSISNSNIKYNISHPQENQPLLDITLGINALNKTLETVPYWRPTASGSYLIPESNHPKHTIQSILFAQFLGLRRLSSSSHIFKKASKRLYQDLKRACYDRVFLREVLLKARLYKPREQRTATNFFFIVQYNETINWSRVKTYLRKIDQKINEHYNKDSTISRALSQKRCLVAFSKLPNVGHYFSSMLNS